MARPKHTRLIPDDRIGQWEETQRIRMDERFVDRVQRAFDRGRGSEAAARATHDDPWRRRQPA